MPYGMPMDEGGDSKKNDKWMENCVQKVMKEGKDKQGAVAICKSTFEKMHKNHDKMMSKSEFLSEPLGMELKKKGLEYLIPFILDTLE
jgi:hypothetical protein